MNLNQELRQTIAELELCSHVSAAQPGSTSRSADEDIGGKRPPGGIDRREDRAIVEHDPKNPERVLRSADHFKRRLAGAHSERTRLLILEQAKASLAAWREPAPPSKEPVKGEPGWKRFIALSTETYKTLADRYGVSTAYISQVRKDYGAPAPRVRKPVDTRVFSVGCSNCGTPDCTPHSDMCGPCSEFQGVRESEADPFEEVAA